MTPESLLAVVVAGFLGAGVGSTIARARLDSPPEPLIRRNFRDRRVPAVLGEALIMASCVGVAALALFRAAGWDAAPSHRISGAIALLTVIMGAAGSWDDHRGDERPRGFRGHLGAFKQLRLTGGLVKMVAGGVAGLVAGAIVSAGDPAATLRIGLIIALSANLINLLDRAPGRVGKVALVWYLLLFLPAAPGWVAAAAAMIGALIVTLPADLTERGMLGDAGANPLGAVLGLGAATAVGSLGGWILIALLLGLNLASEKWSFSRVISSNAWLSAADMWGRERS